MQAIHRLSPNMVDMVTRLDIFSVYVQPYVIYCPGAIPFTPKTTVKAFCTHFMATLRNVARLP